METENSQEKTTLVLGGTGKTGRQVVERLTARGLPTRVGSRSGEPPFDWEKRATWAPAVRDVESVYLTYYPDLAAPGAAATVRWSSWRSRAGSDGWYCSPAGRGRGPAQRADATRLRRRLDDPALELVQPELQRELPARRSAERRARAAGRRSVGAIRRR